MEDLGQKILPKPENAFVLELSEIRESMRKIARETGINRESARLIAKNELGLRPYKLQKVQLFADKMKVTRLKRCRALMRRVAGQKWEKILFTDEKLFTVEASHNHQNDRIWSANSPGSSAIISHSQHPQSVMVWGGICASGKTPLIFVAEGVKINAETYQRDILESVVLPWPSDILRQTGRFSRIQLQRIGHNRLNSGFQPTFPTLSHLENGHRIVLI